jgi:hypothetical protein
VIYRLRGTPAATIGSVYAPNERVAIERAIEEFQITDPQQQKRLVAVRCDNAPDGQHPRQMPCIFFSISASALASSASF